MTNWSTEMSGYSEQSLPDSLSGGGGFEADHLNDSIFLAVFMTSSEPCLPSNYLFIVIP
jgi:hypothetical protein